MNDVPHAIRMIGKHSSFTAVAVLTLWRCCWPAGVLAEDWPQWRGPKGDGISAESGLNTDWPKEGPKRLWKTSVGSGFSSVAIAKGRLFTAGNHNENDTVYCLDTETGKELWRHSYPARTDPAEEQWGPA